MGQGQQVLAQDMALLRNAVSCVHYLDGSATNVSSKLARVPPLPKDGGLMRYTQLRHKAQFKHCQLVTVRIASFGSVPGQMRTFPSDDLRRVPLLSWGSSTAIVRYDVIQVMCYTGSSSLVTTTTVFAAHILLATISILRELGLNIPADTCAPRVLSHIRPRRHLLMRLRRAITSGRCTGSVLEPSRPCTDIAGLGISDVDFRSRGNGNHRTLPPTRRDVLCSDGAPMS
nr:hypothetical protein CFP56_04312 [Quercus suber]